LLNRNVEEFNRRLNVGPSLERNLQWEMKVDELTEVVLVGVTVGNAFR
jgi:hypothetical protein